MASEDIPLFNWYLRYPVGPADMDQFQESLVQIPRETFGETNAAALLYGGTVAPSGSTMAVTVTAFSAVNDNGYLCAKNSTSLVAIAASHATLHRYDLIVARPLLEDDQTISRPTSPFDNVPLYELQNCQLAVVQGTNGATPAVPAKVAGDVILASVYVPATATSISGGNINQTTHHDIGREPRFASFTNKNLIVRARGGNTIGIAGYGSGEGEGGYFEGGEDIGGGPGAGIRTRGIGTAYGAILSSDDGVGSISSGDTRGADFDGPGDGTQNTDIAIRVNQNIDFNGGNPAAGEGFSNFLTPMNLIKAWGLITLTSGTPAVTSGFNITNPAFVGAALAVDLVDDLSGVNGIVLITNQTLNGSFFEATWYGYFDSSGGRVLLFPRQNSGGVEVSWTGSNGTVGFVVLGAQ